MLNSKIRLEQSRHAGHFLYFIKLEIVGSLNQHLKFIASIYLSYSKSTSLRIQTRKWRINLLIKSCKIDRTSCSLYFIKVPAPSRYGPNMSLRTNSGKDVILIFRLIYF